MKNNISKYIAGTASALLLAGSVAIATASAQILPPPTPLVGVNVFVTASTSLRGIGMRGHMGSTTMRDGSSTRMSSTTRQQMLDQQQTQDILTIDMHSTAEINARITSLNSLLARVNTMTKLSAAEKAAITTEVNNLIADLTALQGHIRVDASSTAIGTRGALSSSSPLRTDMNSITKDFRVYALVIPQIEILAAADRAGTLVASFTTLAVKLQTRITAIQAERHDVTGLQASLSDLNAKIADAQIQSTNAINVTANLVPDNGNATIAASNSAALKTGRADIKAADSDIKAATADAKSMVRGVEGLGGGVSASSSVSVSASSSISASSSASSSAQ